MSKTSIQLYKRRATVAANKTETTINAAVTLLALPDVDIVMNNLSNTIDNLVDCKEKMEACEAEIQTIINEDPTASPDEKEILEKSLKDHLLSVKFPQLMEGIAETMDLLQQRLDSNDTGDSTCRGDSPVPSDQASAGSRQQEVPKTPQANSGRSAKANNTDKRMDKIEETLSRLTLLLENSGRGGVWHTNNTQSSSDSTNMPNNQGNPPPSCWAGHEPRAQSFPTNPQPFGFNPGFNPNFSAGFNPGCNTGFNTRFDPSGNTGFNTGFNPRANAFNNNSGYYPSNPMAEFEMHLKMEQAKSAFITSSMAALKPFSGEACDYSAFMAQFDCLVHQNSFADVKMKQTLLTNLLPPALAREHQTTEISEEKYQMIRHNLERQFNRQYSQFNLMRRDIENIKFPANDMVKLQSALNTYSTLAYKMQCFGVNPNDRFFISSLADKLPNELRRATMKMLSNGQPTLNDVMNKIYDIVAAETGLGKSSPKLSLGYDENYVNTIAINAVSSRPLQTSAKARGTKTKKVFVGPSKEKPCRYCEEDDHCAAECKIPYEQKREAVQKKNLCYNCLSERHTVVDCKSRFNCVNCQKRHFTGHCPLLKNKPNVSINVSEYINLEDDEELEQQLFRGTGAETPEH